MSKTLTALFDGQVLHPDTPPDLEPNVRYVIVIQDEISASPQGNAWDVLDALAGTLDAPVDWASEHDHYLHNTPKRHEKAAA